MFGLPGHRNHDRFRRLCIGIAAVGALIGASAFLIAGYRGAIAPPIVRSVTVRLPAAGGADGPIRLVLFSDLHVHGPDMPPERVLAIVRQINALHPDVVVSAGDFVGDNLIGRTYPIDQAIAPLGQLRAKFGVFAVLGNNDYDAGGAAVRAALERAHVRVLKNDAVQVGPLAIGGIDGSIQVGKAEWKARRARAVAALDRTPGMRILVAHRPDEFRFLSPSVGLLLSGHTHCGQIVLPLLGPLETGSDYGRKYLCGIIRNGRQVMVVTAGVGTSHVPLRIGAPPDIWEITVRSE